MMIDPNSCTTATTGTWSFPYRNQTITTTGTSVTANISSTVTKDNLLEAFKKETEYAPSGVYDKLIENLYNTVYGEATNTYSTLDGDDFKKVIEYVPSKVYGFIFNDGKEIKTICDPSDTFDFDFAFYLAAAKHIWGKELTLEGVINKANELKTTKKWVKRVEKAKKKFAEDIKKEVEKEIEEQLKKERHERYVAKKKRRDARKKAEADERLKQTILEAIKESR